MTYDVEYLFMLICHLHIFLAEVSIKVFGLFLNCLFNFLVLSFKGSLYIYIYICKTYIFIFCKYFLCVPAFWEALI